MRKLLAMLALPLLALSACSEETKEEIADVGSGGKPCVLRIDLL